ncbi:MAG: histidine phosphatase family protein [Lachnospiraceae bacterium]|nr:histidine phosphatase family protein [Lachnospiraceae bacterium]
MRLILVRHGEPDYKNDCLTNKGIQQAKNTAARLEKEGISAIYSSPMGRAFETAGYTADSQGLKVKILDFMHEIDWGDIQECKEEDKLLYNGHPWALGFKLLTENPGYVGSGDWDNHHYFKDNKCLNDYKKVSSCIDDFLDSFGLKRREGLYYCERNCEDTVAIFAHGGSGAIMISHILSLPFPFVLTTMPFNLCSISVIEFIQEAGEVTVPMLSLFNDTGHIEGLKREPLYFEN